MQITNKNKIKEALELLEEVKDLINDGIEINDDELHGPLDIYNQVTDIIISLEDEVK